MLPEPTKALSLNERAGFVRRAIDTLLHAQPAVLGGATIDGYTDEVYDEYAIVSDYRSGAYYRVPYTMTGQDVTAAELDQWEKVEKDWVETKTLVEFGETLKALGEGKFGGYLVTFSDAASPDLEGDFFTPDTDFNVVWDANNEAKTVVKFNHGLDPVLKKRTIGEALLRKDDVGIWLETILHERDAYEKAVADLSRKGIMGLSSGAAPHLVERERVGKAWHVKSWAIAESSITHTPAEPRNHLLPLKSLAAQIVPITGTPSHKAQQPEASADAAAQGAGTADIHLLSSDEDTMTTATQEQANAPVTREEFDAVAKRLGKFIDFLEQSPAIKSSGFFSVDGGTADKTVKSFGDFLKAVQRNDVKRLTDIYETKAVQEESGAAGGFLIAAQFIPQLLEMTGGASIVRPRATVIPVTSPTGSIPALGQFTAPTAGDGDTAYAGGVTLEWTEESGTTTETDPDFEKVEWHVRKLAGRTKVSNEMLSDSKLLEAILMRLFARAVAAKEDAAFLRGDGVGKPYGILSAPGAIGIAPDTNSIFVFADAVEMVSRFQPIDPTKSAWAINRTMLTDLAQFEVGTGGAVFVNNIVAGVPMTLLGYPILMSEHLPLADASGCVLLADFSAYVIFDLQEMAVAFSEHAAFNTDEGTWRVTSRVDGKPWVRSAVSEANPGSPTTVGPFVYFND